METESVLFNMKGLPPFPETALKAIKIIKDPNSSVQDLVEVIQYDQNITANVLRFANSAYYGLKSKVKSLKQAVALLGTDAIMDMLFISGSLSYFHDDLTGYGIKGEDLLNHSISTALMCRILAEKAGMKENATSVFTAGLLHDIGKVVLNSFVKDKYEEIENLVSGGNRSFLVAEREILGMDHAEVGGKVAEKWGLPEEIVAPVSLHHIPEEAAKDDMLTPIVFLANQADYFINNVRGADNWSFKRIKAALSRCKLGEDKLDETLAEANDAFESVRDLLGS